MHKLIVGIDPGTTAAVAVVDISSDYYEVYSARGFAFSDACDYIITRGSPIVVSADKTKSNSARKTAAAFSARLWLPAADITNTEKDEITKDFIFSNDHERDALAAALSAKEYFRPLFEKIDRQVEKSIADDVKELIIKNEAGNIESAVRMLAKEERTDRIVVPRLVHSKKYYELNIKIEELERKIERMNFLLSTLEKENAELRKESGKPPKKPSRIVSVRKVDIEPEPKNKEEDVIKSFGEWLNEYKKKKSREIEDQK
jgi:predicted RNase H-like nuclease (RuvC/YqgF family)